MVEMVTMGYLRSDPIVEYTITNKLGNHVKILNLGLSITSVLIDNNELVLSYDRISEYIENEEYLGSFIGRFANRIKDGKVTLDGKEFNLVQNDGTNHLHGGGFLGKGFSHKMWLTSEDENHNTIIFSLSSEDREAGYPSDVIVYCKVMFSDANELILDIRAYPDEKTFLNFTSHAYFNLDGFENHDIRDNKVTLYADKYMEVDAEGIPTGNVIMANNGKDDIMDFSSSGVAPRRIGDGVDKLENELNKRGYDNCYLISHDAPRYNVYTKESYKTDLTLNKMARAEGKLGSFELYSSKQAFQFYTGGSLKGILGKKKIPLDAYRGFCIEPQFVPNSPNMREFNTCFFSPIKPYHHIILYRFEGVSK